MQSITAAKLSASCANSLMSHSISRAHSGGFFLSHKLAVVNLFEQTQNARPLSFPCLGTVCWALGRVSAHKRSVCRVSEANRTCPRTNVRDNLCQLLTQLHRVCRASAASLTRIEITPTAVVKSRQLPWYTLYIHCTYTYEFCRYRQN